MQAALARRVAVAQLCTTIDKARNLDICERLVRDAASKGVQLLCFPEVFDFMASTAEERVRLAEPIMGPDAHLVNRFCRLAKDHKIWLSLGYVGLGASEGCGDVECGRNSCGHWGKGRLQAPLQGRDQRVGGGWHVRRVCLWQQQIFDSAYCLGQRNDRFF